jgi:molecular chaperone GrpE
MDDEKNNNKKEESSFAKDSEDKEEIVIEETTDEGGNLDFQEKIKQLQEKLKKCQELKEEYLGGWQRAKADLINARKDDERRNQEFVKFANASLVFEILPVLDSFDLACVEAEKDSKFVKGVSLIKLQLENILRKYGLESIKSTGEKFNLQFHEIVGEINSDKEPGIVMEEIQKGYLLFGKVIRPAKVRVSAKGGSASG